MMTQEAITRRIVRLCWDQRCLGGADGFIWGTWARQLSQRPWFRPGIGAETVGPIRCGGSLSSDPHRRVTGIGVADGRHVGQSTSGIKAVCRWPFSLQRQPVCLGADQHACPWSDHASGWNLLDRRLVAVGLDGTIHGERMIGVRVALSVESVFSSEAPSILRLPENITWVLAVVDAIA